jgi:hypothetical protein
MWATQAIIGFSESNTAAVEVAQRAVTHFRPVGDVGGGAWWGIHGLCRLTGVNVTFLKLSSLAFLAFVPRALPVTVVLQVGRASPQHLQQPVGSTATPLIDVGGLVCGVVPPQRALARYAVAPAAWLLLPDTWSSPDTLVHGSSHGLVLWVSWLVTALCVLGAVTLAVLAARNGYKPLLAHHPSLLPLVVLGGIPAADLLSTYTAATAVCQGLAMVGQAASVQVQCTSLDTFTSCATTSPPQFLNAYA